MRRDESPTRQVDVTRGARTIRDVSSGLRTRKDVHLRGLLVAVAIPALLGAASGTAAGFGSARLGRRVAEASETRSEPWGRVITARTPLGSSGDPQIVVSPSFASDGTAVLATDQGVMATTDGGVTWQTIGFAGQAISAIAVSPNFKNGSSGAIYVAATQATTPIGVVGNGGYGNAQVWFIQNVSAQRWIPTHVYAAPEIDALAVNAQGQLFMSVPGEYGIWARWSVGTEGEPTIDVEQPGLWMSPDAGNNWSYVLPDNGACGLAFDAYGTGYFFDRTGAVWWTGNGGGSWNGPPGAFPFGPLSSPTFASWSGAQSYLLGLAGPQCGGYATGPGTLVYQGSALTSLYDQMVTAVAADPPFAIPGHKRGLAFAATASGIYVGGVDSTGDFWSRLVGSPTGTQALAAGASSSGPVAFVFDGRYAYRLDVAPSVNVPGLAMTVGGLPSPVYQGSAISATARVTSVNGWSGTVDFADPRGPAGAFSVTTPSAQLGRGSSASASYALSTTSVSPPGSWLVYPVAAAADKSAYVGDLTQTVAIAPPPVYLLIPPISPSFLAVRAGTSASATVTVSPGPSWTSAYRRVALSIAGPLPAGVNARFSPAIVDISSGGATSTVTIAAAQSATLGNDEIVVRASSDGAQTSGTLGARIDVPVPSSFSFAPTRLPDVFRDQGTTTTITALAADGSVLNDYSGAVATLTDALDGVDRSGAAGESITFSAGVAKVDYFLDVPGNDRLTVADRDGTPRTTSPPFQVERPPSAFAFSPIGTQHLDQPFGVTVRAVDMRGTTVSLYAGSPWIADRSGFLYQQIGPFRGGTWTGRLSVPVLVKGDVLTAGDPSGGWPIYAPFSGSSPPFDVVLPSPLPDPGSWPQPGHDAGATNDDPSALLFSSSVANAKVAFRVPTDLGRACKPGVVPQCTDTPSLTSSAPPVVADGVLVPGWLAGLAAETGQLLWAEHDYRSEPAVTDGRAAVVCGQRRDSIWWPPSWSRLGTASPFEGPEAMTLSGDPAWGPLPTSAGCAQMAAVNGTLYAVRTGGGLPGASGATSAAPTFPLRLEALRASSAAPLWTLPLPAPVARPYWNTRSGGYADAPTLRVTSSSRGDVVLIANCTLLRSSCAAGYALQPPPLWIGAASGGRWLWQRALTDFPYGQGPASQVIDRDLGAFGTDQSVSAYLRAVSHGAYSTLDQAAHHLIVASLVDMAASDGTVYLSVQLGLSRAQPGGVGPVADGIVAVDATTGRPLWETVLWFDTGFQLVLTPQRVLLVSVHPSQASTHPPVVVSSTPPPPLPPSAYKPLGDVVAALDRTDGRSIFWRAGLSFAFPAAGAHATAGGGLIFAGGSAIDATTGSVIGALPDESCSAQAANTVTPVTVAGQWLYYVACATGRLTAVQMPAANIALALAQEAYALAGGSAAGAPSAGPVASARADRARQAAIAAALFDAAGDRATARQATALAAQLGWHPLPTTPPAPTRPPAFAASLHAVVPPAPAASPLPGVIGVVVGLAVFVLTSAFALRTGRRPGRAAART